MIEKEENEQIQNTFKKEFIVEASIQWNLSPYDVSIEVCSKINIRGNVTQIFIFK